MTTLIKRKIDDFNQLKHFKTDSELILLSNKSKTLNWWRVLNIKKSVQCTKPNCVPVSEKVCDQVRLDVKRAFCFDSGLSSIIRLIKDYQVSYCLLFLLLEVDITEMRDKLYKVIISVLERNPLFKYYQVQNL